MRSSSETIDKIGIFGGVIASLFLFGWATILLVVGRSGIPFDLIYYSLFLIHGALFVLWFKKKSRIEKRMLRILLAFLLLLSSAIYFYAGAAIGLLYEK